MHLSSDDSFTCRQTLILCCSLLLVSCSLATIWFGMTYTCSAEQELSLLNVYLIAWGMVNLSDVSYLCLDWYLREDSTFGRDTHTKVLFLFATICCDLYGAVIVWWPADPNLCDGSDLRWWTIVMVLGGFVSDAIELHTTRHLWWPGSKSADNVRLTRTPLQSTWQPNLSYGSVVDL